MTQQQLARRLRIIAASHEKYFGEATPGQSRVFNDSSAVANLYVRRTIGASYSGGLSGWLRDLVS